MRRLVALSSIVALLSYSTAKAATELDVVINEVCWMGNHAQTGDEWIELYNTTVDAIDLTGWKLVETDAEPEVIHEFQANSCSDSPCVISAGGYLLVESKTNAVAEITDFVSETLSLINSGENIQLRDESDNVIDDLGTSAGWHAGTNGSNPTDPIVNNDYSMERINPAVKGNISTNWMSNNGIIINGTDSTGLAYNATPGAQNSVYDNTYVPTAEIVHLMNVSDTEIDLYFQLEIEAGYSAADLVNYSITQGGTPVDTTGTILTIDDADKTIVHLTNLPSLSSDIKNFYTLTITGDTDTTVTFVGGVADISLIKTDADADTIPDLYDSSSEVFVTITGITTDVDNIDYKSTYVQDSTAGILIYDQTTTNTLSLGDEIRVSCFPKSFYNGVFQLTDCKAIVLAQGLAATPVVVTIADLLTSPELYESRLIYIANATKTSGTWPDYDSWANLTITDDGGSNELTLRIDSDTNIDGWTEPGYPLDVIGIGGQYDSSAPHDSGYQILPRSKNDFLPANNNTGCGGDDANCVGVFPNAAGVCNSSDICEMGDCDQLKGDCNNAQLDGCETDLGIATACSSCSDDCTSLQNATADPVTPCNITNPDNPYCAFTCNDTFGDCDTNLLNGCETQLGVDSNCSVCGDDCTDEGYANATGSCNTDAEAICEYICDAGLGDCDNDLPTNGCEETLTDNAENCGLCGNDCGVGNVSCVTDTCVCADGFADCDSSIGTGGDGCETPLGTATDCAECGDECAVLPNTQNQSCDTTDPANPFCDFECTGVFQDCNADALDGCEAEIGTAQYCVDCSDNCTARPNAAASTCGAGPICVLTCDAHYGDCDADQSNGCEVTLGTLTQCSTCTDDCGTNGLCDTSTETYVCGCVEGFADCFNGTVDGCETTLGVPQYCSACDDDCTDDFLNAEGLCTEGACAMGDCSTDFADCDQDGLSCETQLKTDTNCTVCGDDCTQRDNAADSTCNTETPICELVCDAYYADCNVDQSDGCEVALGSNTQCSSCVDDCGDNAVCNTSGVDYVCECSEGFLNCDAQAGCETELGTPEHCSGCDDNCTDDFPNAAGLCTEGACAMGACDTNYADCDGDGVSCEASLTSKATCGNCETTCTGDDNCIQIGGNWQCGTCEDQDQDGFADQACGGGDCDDSNPAINPDATEVCDHVDNNCSEGIDEGFDLDQDGVSTCDEPADCDDSDSANFPGNTEVCDLQDNDCDTEIDEGFDVDQDSFSTCAEPIADCDDSNPAINPNATEICDSVNNNCNVDGNGNPLIDEGFVGLGDACDDDDADLCAFGTISCNDTHDDTVCAGDTDSPEICDGIDNDCDTEVDEDWPTLGDACDGIDDDICKNGTLACNDSHDGLVCVDDTPKPEACNGLDDDCDGLTDEDFEDDGLGDACDGDDSDKCAKGTLVCNNDENGLTCDEDPNSNSLEICNNVDDDCDDEIDEDWAGKTLKCGVGECEVTVPECDNGVLQNCNMHKVTPPEIKEVSCNDGKDNDCNGFTDDADTNCSSSGGGGGCGCSAATKNPTSAFAILLMGLVMVVRRRKRAPK